MEKIVTQEECLVKLSRRCYPPTGNGWYSWCLSSNLSLLVRISALDEVMDVVRPTPQGAHYYADVT